MGVKHIKFKQQGMTIKFIPSVNIVHGEILKVKLQLTQNMVKVVDAWKYKEKRRRDEA